MSAYVVHLNLATQPFENRRRFYVLSGTVSSTFRIL